MIGFDIVYLWTLLLVRVIHLNESRWPNKFDWTMTTTYLNNWTWPKLKPTNLMKTTNLNFTSGVLLISVPDIFFLVEEWSKVSQPVLAWEPWLRDLSKLTLQAYFWGLKLMLVGVANSSQIQKIRFVIVKIFWSYSDQFSVILIRSS